jgi:hypothetical protein
MISIESARQGTKQSEEGQRMNSGGGDGEIGTESNHHFKLTEIQTGD